MNHDDGPAYGLWVLVILNSLVFIIFAFSFSKPRSPRDWRSFGAFSAFIVALFTEMNVWLPADNLSPLRLVTGALSRH